MTTDSYWAPPVYPAGYDETNHGETEEAMQETQEVARLTGSFTAVVSTDVGQVCVRFGGGTVTVAVFGADGSGHSLDIPEGECRQLGRFMAQGDPT